MELIEVKRQIREGKSLHELVFTSGMAYKDLLELEVKVFAERPAGDNHAIAEILPSLTGQEIAVLPEITSSSLRELDYMLVEVAKKVVSKLSIVALCTTDVYILGEIADTVSTIRSTFNEASNNTKVVDDGEIGESRFKGRLKK